MEELEVSLMFNVTRKLETMRETVEGFTNTYTEEVERIVMLDGIDIESIEPVKLKELILTLINNQL